jgi:effector-binding domain-containing protein
MTLLFHDRYFCSSFASYKLWYVKIIDYLKENGHSFIGFRETVREFS